MFDKASRIVALLLLGAILSPSQAQAVVIQPGQIETSGDRATVDLIYFSLTDIGDTDITVDPLCLGLCGVITTERAGLTLYANDGLGGIGALIASIPGDAVEPSATLLNLDLAVGDYILAVSARELLAGELPPFQTDDLVNLPFDYEAGFSGLAGTNAVITCLVEGNLDGSLSVTRFANANCRFSPVPEPAGLAWLALGVAALPLSARRRRA